MNKGEKMGKRGASPFGGIRKRLSDITNMHSQRSSPNVATKNQENALLFDGSSTKSYIDQLLVEKATMMKTIQEKELEMQKLRALVHKAQLQNWQLAQSNSQMLAELNLGKDKLKVLRHELACKEALMKAKITKSEFAVHFQGKTMEVQTNELQENAMVKGESHDSEVCELLQTQGKETNPNNKSEKNVPRNRKRQPPRSRSMGPTASQQAADKEKAENKRRCVRRQSVKLNPKAESETDLIEIDVGNKSNSDDNEEASNEWRQRRSSLRRGVAKVTYKEPSLKYKVRRPA